MKKIIKADIDCLLNTIKRAIDEDNTTRAIDATSLLVDRVTDLARVDTLREVSAHESRS